ncbi:MAG: DNA recombination protein RmuC [Betaproteobacteria bacterium]|nr:DNA recombination protein RmuC [Betaproteobacteria bacterium]
MGFESLVIAALVINLALAVVLIWLAVGARKGDPNAAAAAAAQADARHRAMLTDLHEGLAKQGERMANSQAEAGERTRQAMAALQLEQTQNLAANREELIRQLAALNLEIQQKQEALKTAMLGGTLEKLNEQALAQQQKIESTLRMVTERINVTVEGLTKSTDKRLEEIGGKVNERLDEGFKKTNETFVNVVARLATIDEAQKKIDGLTTNVVSLQQLLGDKRSRGALGERQLEDIIKNALPESVYEFQYTFASGKVRADCVLKLPEPTGLIAVDSKFPLESYERMFAEGPERVSAAVFKTSVKKHVDDIADKYIIPGETGEGAVMFIPAEAVFAEIHGNHRDLIDYAANRRVWLVSPTTLMAVLNTARVVLKDVQTRKQIHIIQDELGKLGADFGRFQSRMDDLAKHIGQANKDVELVHTSSKKISERFQKIEKAELDVPSLEDAAKPNLTLIKSDSDN